MAQNPFDQTLEDLEREQRTAQQRAPENPFLRTLEELRGESETQIRTSMMAAQETTPDRRAEAVALATRTGIPVETIERNFDAIKKRATITETPYSRMMAETPHLAEWLKEPDYAAVAHDDLAPLGALDWLMTAPSRAVAQGINQVRFARLKTAGLFRSLTREELDQLDAYKHHMTLGGELGAAGSWWRQAVTGAARLLPNLGAAGLQAAQYGAVGALEVGAVGAAGGSLLPGVGTAAGAAGGALIGAQAGALYGGARFGFELEAGLALDEYEQFADQFGVPIEPDVARAAAIATGVMNAGLEAYGLTKLAQTIPGLKELTGPALRSAVKEALKRPTVRGALADAMRSYVGGLTAETFTEVAQRVVTVLSGEVAKYASDRPIAHLSAGDVIEEAIAEGVGAIQSFGLIALPGPSIQVAADLQRARQADRNVEFFRAIGAGVSGSKTAERAPAAVEDLIARAVAEGPAETVYAPVETWATYFQSKGLDPAEVAAEVTGNPNALAEAEASGGLIAIPTERYAVRLAPTAHNEFLATELKLTPDGMNARERAAFAAEQEAIARTEAETPATAPSVVEQIRAQLQERIEAGGIPTQTAVPLAQLMTRGFALAESIGMDPQALFDRYGLTVERHTLGDGTTRSSGPITETAVQPSAVGEMLDEAISGDTLFQSVRAAASLDWSDFGVRAESRFTIDDTPYLVTFSPVDTTDGHRTVTVNFAIEGAADDDRSFALAGTGRAGRVLGTVQQAIQEYLDDRAGSVDEIAFSATEPSRVSLYRRLLTRAGVTFQERRNLDGEVIEDTTNSPRVFVVDVVESQEERYDPTMDETDRKVGETRRKLFQRRAADITWSREGGTPIATFSVAGRDYVVTFSDITEAVAEGGPRRQMTGDPSGGPIVNIQFSRVEAGELEDGITGDTGVGAARQIFASVYAAAEQYLQQHEVATFTLVAREPSRQKLYRRALGDAVAFESSHDWWMGNARDAVAFIIPRSRLEEHQQSIRFQGHRGAIQFGEDRKVRIQLFEHADLSTFLHETGHFYLELLGDLVESIRDVSEEALTPAQRRLRTDWATLLEQLAVTDRAGIGRAQHERFAEMFERYLMEGKAPSVELQAIFSRFRAWLLSVYRSLRMMGANLTPEVRGVFDRMLATDEQIAAAEARGRVSAMFATAEDAGMSEAEFAAYQETGQRAHATAIRELDAKLLGEVRREQEATWRRRRAEIEAEVTAVAHQAPIYRALAAIRYGQHPDGTSLVEGVDVPPLKLDRQAIVDRYGEDRLKRLPRPYVYTRTGGVDPDLVAERFEFSSGDELLTAVQTAPPMAQAIRQETDARMLAEHGSMLLDGSVVEAAQEAVSSETRDAVIRLELRALWRKAREVRPFVRQAQQAGREAVTAARAETAEARRAASQLREQARRGPATIARGIPDAATIRQVAQTRIAQSKIADITPSRYWHAARRAAQAALDFAAQQEFDDAVLAKTEELLNVALYREAERARADIDVRVRRAQDLGRPQTQARLGLAGSTYLEQILGVLDRYSFARVSARELAKRARMRDWMEAQEAQGIDVSYLPQAIRDDLRRVDYQTITYEELVGVTDGLAQIVHLARLKNRLLTHQDERAFSRARDALETSIRAHSTTTAAPIEFDRSAERRLSVQDWFASHAKIATLARMFDGHQDGGAFWEAIIRPLNAAADAEQARRTQEGERFRALIQTHYPGGQIRRLSEKVYIPAIGGSLSLEARLAVALNWGNESSRQRVLADPARRWTQPGVDAILDTLEEHDWRFVQATWDHINSFWPEIAAKTKRLTGLEPEKVEAMTVTTKYGEFAGGYYPLLADYRYGGRQAQHEAATAAKLATAAAYVQSTTRRGHLEARVQTAKYALRLDLGVAFQHVDQVMHDLTHHETLIDVTRLIRDGKVSAAIHETRGPAVYEQFTRALQDIALGTGMGPQRASVIDKSVTYMRTGAQLAAMGWNLWTAAQQPLGLFNGMERVGVRWVARGMHRWLRDAASMESTTTWIARVSPFMAGRVVSATQDIADVRQSLLQVGGWFDTMVRTVTADRVTQQSIVDSYLWHIGLMQRVADVPTWLGAYEKAMADPANNGDEQRAVALADQAVRDSQGSGQIHDLAQVQRGGPVAKLFMTFYSYGNTVYNRTAATVDEFRAHGSVPALLGHLTLLYVMPAIGTVTMANALGRSDDDEPEEWITAVGAEMLASALNTMVLVRELSRIVGEGNRGYAGPAGARVIESGYGLATQVKQGEADEALWKATNSVAGVLFRYPAGQVQRTVDGFVALQEGTTHNPLALLFGAPQE